MAHVMRPPSTGTGDVRPMIHVMHSSRRTRITIASISPTLRALACCSFGSLSASTEMKMMLSIPSTISSTVSVTSAMAAWPDQSDVIPSAAGPEGESEH